MGNETSYFFIVIKKETLKGADNSVVGPLGDINSSLGGAGLSRFNMTMPLCTKPGP